MLNADNNNLSEKPCLHDCLALGQLEAGLSAEPRLSMEEMHRLPLLLRLLTAARLLSSIPTFGCDDKKRGTSFDAILDTAVQRLEDRAAMYSVAESVEVSCHLAPVVTKRAVKRKNTESQSSSKRQKTEETVLLQEDEDEMMESARDASGISPIPGKEREASILVAAQDTQEAVTSRTFSELLQLINKSLLPLESQPLEDEGAGAGEREATGSSLSKSKSGPKSIKLFALSMDDSILAEAKQGTGRNGVNTAGGAMVGSDLGATISSLLHHAPSLRHDQVANAFCRANLPQCSDLLYRLGANCPAAVPSLVKGCVSLYRDISAHLSIKQNMLIAQSIRRSVKALSRLSKRESFRILHILRRDRVMIDVQLEVAMEHDPLIAVSLILLHRGDGHESWEFVVNSNPKLVSNLFTHLQAQMDRSRVGLFPSRTRLTMTLAAFSRLMIITRSMPQKLDVANSWHVWRGAIAAMKDCSPEAVAKSSPIDQPCQFLCLAIALLLFAEQHTESTRLKLFDILKELRTCAGQISYSTRTAFAITAASLRFGDSDILKCLTERSVFSKSFNLGTCWSVRVAFSSLDPISTSEVEFEDMIKLGTDEIVFQADQSAVLAILRSDSMPMSLKSQVAERAVIPTIKCDSARFSLLQDSTVADCVELCAAILAQNGSAIPIVSPLVLERNFISMNLRKPLVCNLIMQLLYCFCFVDFNDASPFAFDPSLIPLSDVLRFLDYNENQIVGSVRDKLRSFVAAFCPHAFSWADASIRSTALVNSSIAATDRSPVTDPRQYFSEMLTKSLVDVSYDQDGLKAEKLFLLSSADFCESELCLITIRHLLSPHRKVPDFYTFHMIYHDPLLLMKCPLTYWKREGLRRVMLRAVIHVLQVNDHLVERAPGLRSTHTEFLAARNLVALKCFVSMSDRSITNSCYTSSAFIRTLVAKSPGLAACLVRQKLPEKQMDWFIDHIPESGLDTPEAGLVTENFSMSVAERLVASDRILRMALTYGHSHGEQTQRVVFAALSQLISAFFLVLGPAGVPVAAENGSTQISRGAALRMIRALSRAVGHHHRLRQECDIALQKLAGLCKGESIAGGLPLSVGARQKSVLKSILDAIAKATEAVGK